MPALLLFALVAGPLLGAAGYGFGSLIERARTHAAQGAQLLWRMPLGYVLLGLLALPFPLILGNGHAMAQNIFAVTLSLGMAFALALAKPVADARHDPQRCHGRADDAVACHRRRDGDWCWP